MLAGSVFGGVVFEDDELRARYFATLDLDTWHLE